MLLGDSSAIYIGDTSIDAIYIGSDLVWSSSPSPYTQLTYIQSTNCQTINTGYIPNENSRIEAEFMLYTSVHNEWGQSLFGNGTWKMYYNRNRALRTEYQFGSGSITTTASILPYHERFKLVCDKNGATWYDTEGVQIGNVSVTGTSPGSSPLYIGSDSNSYYSEYRIYSFKIYEGNTLVMNLIPVQRNGDGVCGLLDTVSGKFFMDAGREGVGYYSDKFTDSYEQLDAVETNRNLYVDTGYVANTNTKLVFDGMSHRGSLYLEGYLFGSWYNQIVGPDTIAFCSVLNTSTSGGTSPFTRGTGNIWLPTAALTDKHAIFTMYGTSLTVHDVDTDTDTTYTVQNTTVDNCKNTLYLFGINRTPASQVMDTCATARCYSCKISEITNGVETLVRDYIPVKRKFDNTIVLYDTISNSEYPPVGGAFTGWSSNIFDTLSFSGGWLDTNGVVQHQSMENYGTSDFFECGNNTKVRVSFTPQYTDERGVMVCAYDENQTFISSPIYTSMKSPYTLEEKEFIGDIPSGAKYLRYSYLWGKYN